MNNRLSNITNSSEQAMSIKYNTMVYELQRTYAESMDGINWIRKDNFAGIGVSPTGWDSEMIEYANIFKFDNMYYMLYNGNDFGKSGIGIAQYAEN